MFAACRLVVTVLLLLCIRVNGFVLPLSIDVRAVPTTTGTALNAEANNRRDFIHSSIAIVATSQLVPSEVANAVMSVDQDVFTAGKNLTPDEARERFKEGRKSLQYLLDNYDKIVEGGGDNVRRYLGTVGTTSGLWGISKVMKSLQNEADDLVEYTESVQELEASIRGADSAAYMAIFVTTSTSQTPPAKYFADAKIEAKRAQKAIDELAAQLNIK